MQLLSTEILDWVDPKDFSLDNYSNNSPIGCFLKVDLGYVDELRDLLKDFLLAGEKIEVKKEMLSDYLLQIIEYNEFFLGQKKRIPNLHNFQLSKRTTLFKFRVTTKKNS